MNQLQLLNPNAQKTHYAIDFAARRKRPLRRPELVGHFGHPNKNRLTDKSPPSPFRPLLEESPADARHRYTLYEKVWTHQHRQIEAILNSANHRLFQNLALFICDPPSAKLDTAFLALSSNTANNLRILDEFSSYVAEQPSDLAHVRIVRLSSRVCFNIKTAMREVVKQIVEGPQLKKDPEASDSEGEQADSEDDDELEAADDDAAELAGGRISYDFEIVREWMAVYQRKKGAENLRIVVILDDSDSFSNEVLNLLIQLLHIYRDQCPLKLVFALSSRNASDWVMSHIASRLRTLINGVRLEAKDNMDIGYHIIDDILLQNEITAENPLLLDAQLSLIILTRFESSNNSIDSLIAELKLSYMIHFYQLPLASLIDPHFQPSDFHCDALRKLPSFKNHIEALVDEVLKTPNSKTQTHIKDLLTDDKCVSRLFQDAKHQFQIYQNAVMNAVNIVHWMCKGDKQKFQIYKLVTNNQLVNSAFFSDLLKLMKNYSEDETKQFALEVLGPKMLRSVGAASDTDLIKLQDGFSGKPLLEYAQDFTHYVHNNKHLNKKISDNLFHEVLTISGGAGELDALKPAVNIEENQENLMINLIRPKSRATIELGLDEPHWYLRNVLVMARSGLKRKRLSGPLISRLYQVYRDAPVNINLWDFYTAFKLSLLQREIAQEIQMCVQEDEKLKKLADQIEESQFWDKLVYAWFLQGCFELTHMGFLREKSKGEYAEKMIWRNL